MQSSLPAAPGRGIPEAPPPPTQRLQPGGPGKGPVSLRRSLEDVRRRSKGEPRPDSLSVPVASPSAEAERPSLPRIPSPPLCPFPSVNNRENGARAEEGTELDLRKNWEVEGRGSTLKVSWLSPPALPAGRWAHSSPVTSPHLRPAGEGRRGWGRAKGRARQR